MKGHCRDTPAETIDEMLAARWPDKDLQVLREAAGRWSPAGSGRPSRSTPRSSDRWMRMLNESSMLTHLPGYDELADDSFMKAYR